MDPATTEIYTLSLHDALPIYLLRDGGRRVVLQARGAGAPAVSDALGRDRPDGAARDHLRVVPHVPAARRPVRGRDLPVLRARGRGGVHAAAAPAARGAAAAGPGGGVSRGARAVRGGDAVHARQRAVAGPAVHGPRVRRHPRRDSRLLRLAARRDADVTSARIDDLPGEAHVYRALVPRCTTVQFLGDSAQ